MNVKMFQTSPDPGDRLSLRKKPLKWEPAPLDSSRIVYLDPELAYQTILGFGGAFTESSADALSRVSKANRRKAIDAYFDPAKGIGYSFCRTHINSCDFSLENYACCDTPEDFGLKTFHIEREKKLLIPLIKDSIRTRGKPITLFASPWSPPAWMKTTGRMNRGGKLRPECRKAWALYYAKFIKAFRKEGVPIWGLTIQNEPQATQTWDSCLWTGEEEGAFVRDHLGPTLEKEGLSKVKIMIWDHNKDHLLRRAQETLSDPKTRKYVWGIAYHWYNGDFFEHLDAVGKLFPDKPLVFSEGCNEYNLGKEGWHWPEHYGHDIIGDLNHGTVAWTDWNIVLDEKGGPNHVGNFCDAPIIADTDKDEIILRPSYYYMGHFSKFILPGAKRIGFAKSQARLEVTAFRNPDRSIVLVAMNRTEDAMEFQVKLGPKAFTTDIPAHAIQTYLIGS
jgi:glucosylceramidase